jgi:quercetin dioxygenase-like cupin family protein
VGTTPLLPRVDGCELVLDAVRLAPGESLSLGSSDEDVLLFVHDGGGAFGVGGEEHALGHAAAGFVLAGEEARLDAGADGLAGVCARVGQETDRHAPLGAYEAVASLEIARSDTATGARSFQALFGPHNGSTRATLFAGFVPPGRAPWHYHLYDEMVWIPDGPARLHLGDRADDLGPGSAFRLRPREVHIVENASPDRMMALLGIFTPAGTPSAAYLTPDVAAEYGFSA